MFFKKVLLSMFCVVMASAIAAQNLIPNQYVLGNTSSTYVGEPFVKENGDYFLFLSVSDGVSNQLPGNLGVTHYGESYFVISKHSQNHDLIWRQSYGGNANDWLVNYVPVNDGFLVSSLSNSPISGTKNIAANGFYHIWLQKIDFDGNIIWQKGYYTDNNLQNAAIHGVAGNEFILSSIAEAGVSGDKSSYGFAGYDGWLIKINSVGDIIWDKAYGTFNQDFAFNFAGSFSNGDILFSTMSFSDISGDKTEDNYGTANQWLLRLSINTGDIIWDKTIGSDNESGAASVRIMNDSIYLMVCSEGGTSGLRTVPQKGFQDIWFLKMDENANILEQYAYGGEYVEDFPVFYFQENGTILLLSRSSSNISIDKNEDCRGLYDIWLLLIDSNGNVIRQKTIGGNEMDSATGLINMINGNFLITARSRSDISGEKTVPRIGPNSHDAWVLEIDAVTLNVVNENLINNQTTLYPNPTSSQLNITFNEATQLNKAVLYDVTGKIILEQSFENNFEQSYTLNVSGLASGVYTLRLESVGGVITRQVVVD